MFNSIGYFPDEIVEMIDLPPHLKQHPYLAQTYGTLKWSIKGVFANYMGWFSGRSYELDPLSQKEEAEEILKLFEENSINVYDKALEALKLDKPKWSMKLCDYLLETENRVHEAKLLKAECLERLAAGQTSFGGRNWVLTAAMELRGDIDIKPSSELIKHKIRATSLFDLFQKMSTMLDAEKTLHVISAAHFHLSDLEQNFILQVKIDIFYGKRLK